MARIFDNIETKFIDGLRDIISNTGVKRTDFCTGYFNLRGWRCISDLVENLTGDYVYEKDTKGHDEKKLRVCRLLVGMAQEDNEDVSRAYSYRHDDFAFAPDPNEVQRLKRKAALNFRKQLVTGCPTKEDEAGLKLLARQLQSGKLCVKLYLKHRLHAKLYLAFRPDDKMQKVQSLLGSSNLTFSGLVAQGELDTEIGDSDNAQKLADWFSDRWDEKYAIDITDMLIEVLNESWASENVIPPYYIYLKTAYHLSAEARNGIDEYELPPVFKKELFDFQATAVKLAARHLDKRGGAMIGDVVGLGKTITACAVAKVYEMRNACSTLILCPANLQDMWKSYVKRYDLKADVQSIAKKFDWKESRYYKLVIVDESHNLRNGNGQRYKNIKGLIEYQGCSVLLLTATPYNKDYSDLANQLRLFIGEDDDLGILPEAYVRELGGQREFSMKHAEDFVRSIKAFEKSSYADDWRELMRLFLVRRTRTFIKRNYAKTDKLSGRKYLEMPDGTKSFFPERVPLAVKFESEKNGKSSFAKLYCGEMLDSLSNLSLPRYALIKYIDDKKTKDATEKELEVIDNLTRAGSSMIGFCRSTLMKRLDSSGLSFLISLYRHILRNAVFLYAIKNSLDLPIGNEAVFTDWYTDEDDAESLEFSDDETNDNDGAATASASASDDGETAFQKNKTHFSFPTNLDHYMKKAENLYGAMLQKKSRMTWIASKYFSKKLATKLKEDCDTLISMLDLCGEWQAENDEKLDALQKLLCTKHANDKVLVFTQFSDTAEYVNSQLAIRGIKNTVSVTGDSKNISETVSSFSPCSNRCIVPEEKQLRVLVATDVLSEGQNLQDAHVIVNFDLPWAIIRLIQRAGRVDRIGQEAEKIYCYSFFPAEGIEKIITLRQRLNDRINANAETVGSDEIFFEGNEQNLEDLYNEKSGSLDEDEDGEVDLASYAYQIWKSAIEANPALAEKIQHLSNVIYSTKKAKEADTKNGVITYAKNKFGNDMLVWLDENENVVTQSQKTILDAISCPADEEALLVQDKHHLLVSKALSLMEKEEFRTAGILGSRFSTKYRLYVLLNEYCSNPENKLFADVPKLAMDDIYNFPLRESAKNILSTMIRRGADIQTIVNRVDELYDAGELVIKNEDEKQNKETEIICSMGIISE